MSPEPRTRDIIEFRGRPIHYEGTIPKDRADSSYDNLLFFQFCLPSVLQISAPLPAAHVSSQQTPIIVIRTPRCLS
jgi:hypothetical protein